MPLSQYAGQRVELVLRTIRRGMVRLRVLEHRGFGTSWEDPVLVLHERLPQRIAAPADAAMRRSTVER